LHKVRLSRIADSEARVSHDPGGPVVATSDDGAVLILEH